MTQPEGEGIRYAIIKVYIFIAVLISVIASEAKQSLATGLLRHFVPRNDSFSVISY